MILVKYLRNWHKERKKRITASKAHKIYRARSEETVFKYFFEESCTHPNLLYGRKMEPRAKDKIKTILDVDIFEIGLVAKYGQPWLAASPDGLLVFRNGEQAQLQIKCPISCSDSKISVPYLEISNLKKGHPYYTQIQIQLYCCEVKIAVLFIYSENDYKIDEVSLISCRRWSLAMRKFTLNKFCFVIILKARNHFHTLQILI